MLYDNHGRKINYLRLAVTDRCNLRCFYCMPEEGINYVPRNELLTYEEMERVIRLLATMGISKIRITGGEPFLRKEMISFLEKITNIDGIEQLHITTNGTLTTNLVPKLKEIGVKSINLSLDSLDPKRFYEITRRDSFETVMQTYRELLAYEIPTKINMVVMNNRNIDDIIPMAMMTKQDAVSIRYIEEMPFNGSGKDEKTLVWDHKAIFNKLKDAFPDIYKIKDEQYSTSANYKIPNFKGSVGIIAAYSRLFCGTCNRIRLTPQGMLKTCLYDDGVFNIKNFIREGATDEQLKDAFLTALGNRAKNGFEAEKRRNFGLPISESMATIGG